MKGDKAPNGETLETRKYRDENGGAICYNQQKGA